MSPPPGGRRPVDWLVFGGFAFIAFAYRTGTRSLLMVLMAVAGLAFARSPASRVIAIACFCIGWFHAPLVGALFLAAAWLVRSSIDTRQRTRAAGAMGARGHAAARMSAHEATASGAAAPPPSPDEVIDELTRQAGDLWPQQAIHHADADVRRRGVRAIGEGADGRSALTLAERLEVEQVDEVRLDIALALRALKQPATVEALVKAATAKHQSWFVQKNAVRALVEIGDARAVPPLVEALGRRDALLDKEILAALPAFGVVCRQVLEEGLHHQSAAVRARCAEALGRLGLGESVPAIAPLLDAREPRVRAAAVAALGQLQGTAYSAALLVRLEEPSWEVRAAAARALGELGYREALPRLIARTEDPHDEVARAAAASLAVLRDPAAIPALVQLLRGEWLRVEAGAAILAIGGGEGLDLLGPLLRQDDVSLVLAALDLLATLGDPRAASDVSELLGREDVDIRVAAIEALGRLGSAHPCRVLAGCLADQDARIRAAAVSAVGRIGCAINLGWALGDREPGVRSAACEALQGTPLSPEALMPLLHDPSADVRCGAVKLVQADATTALIARSAALLHDPDPRVVHEAVQALRRVGLDGGSVILGELSRLDWHACRYCVEQLGAWSDAVLLLIGATRSPEALVRWCAVEALRHVGEPAARAALAKLREEERDARVRELLGTAAS